MGAKEPVDIPHEVNCDRSCKKLFELALDLRVFREVNEVVEVYAKSERSQGRGSCWVGWVDYVACKETWVRGIVLEAKAVEYHLDLSVPVPGASTEYVQGTFEEPILVLLGIRIADWRFEDCDFLKLSGYSLSPSSYRLSSNQLMSSGFSLSPSSYLGMKVNDW